jgi:hypothetical protein
MTTVKQAIAATLAALLTLTALASVRPGVTLAEGNAQDTVVDEEPVPSTTVADAPAEAVGSATVDESTDSDATADTPSDDSTQARTSPPPPRSRRDPRWIDFRKCRAGFWTCAIAAMHQKNGKYMWRDGRVFVTWDGRQVRGHRGHTWTTYRRQARQLVAYFKAIERAQAEQRRRDTLVRRWSGVARCESGGRWNIATGNGYYGGLQFSLSTWRAVGGTGYPHHQPAWKQAEVADRLRVSSGLHHWPRCGRLYG